jgi:hypothetical protein
MERDVSSGNVGGGGLGNLDEEIAKVTMEETVEVEAERRVDRD